MMKIAIAPVNVLCALERLYQKIWPEGTNAQENTGEPDNMMLKFLKHSRS